MLSEPNFSKAPAASPPVLQGGGWACRSRAALCWPVCGLGGRAGQVVSGDKSSAPSTFALGKETGGATGGPRSCRREREPRPKVRAEGKWEPVSLQGRALASVGSK